MVLAHELFGSGNEGVIVMHDFYGCKDTWSFTRNFFNTNDFTFAFTEELIKIAKKNGKDKINPKNGTSVNPKSQ